MMEPWIEDGAAWQSAIDRTRDLSEGIINDQPNIIITPHATRPAVAMEGTFLYEVDTERTFVYDGVGWKPVGMSWEFLMNEWMGILLWYVPTIGYDWSDLQHWYVNNGPFTYA